MPSSHPARAVIFDCDGVLVDSEPIAMAAHVKLLQSLGVEITPAELSARYLGITDEDMCADIARRTGIVIPDDYMARFLDAVLAGYERALQPIPGVKAFIEALTLPLAVASNSTEAMLHQALRSTGLTAFFEGRIVSAETVARPKPAPDVYLKAAETLGMAPQDCVVIEDSRTGTTAAVAAGMRVIGFTGTAPDPTVRAQELRAAGASETAADMDAIQRLFAAHPTTAAS